jgi:hypothetical protein
LKEQGLGKLLNVLLGTSSRSLESPFYEICER